MGKKKITNKFAATKRIISTQDHRMYQPPNLESKTKPRKNSTTRSEEKQCRGKLLTMLKSAKCTTDSYSAPKNLPASFSLIIMPSVPPTASCLIPTSSTSAFRTNLTSSKPAWTAFLVSASPILLIASLENFRSSVLNTESL